MSMLAKASVPVIVLLLSEKCHLMAKINCILQPLLFLLTSNIPCLFTNRMSFVDISWPWGLVTIGLCPLFSGVNMDTRTMIVSGAYIISGLRMGMGGIALAIKGHLNNELPRYEYQRIRWEKRGVTSDNKSKFMITMQAEIMVQCVANMGLLSLPLMLQSNGYLTGPLTILEIFGWFLWCSSLIWEHQADMQKLEFARNSKKTGIRSSVCNVGLWKYCRHPNYFGEWMVWNSLILTSIPSSIAMLSLESNLLIKLVMSLGLIQVSMAMYNCLVYYTGAVPSEFYSISKRKGYKQYQETTNMFFPWFNKKGTNNQ